MLIARMSLVVAVILLLLALIYLIVHQGWGSFGIILVFLLGVMSQAGHELIDLIDDDRRAQKNKELQTSR